MKPVWERIIDSFAGGGGASKGIEFALGRSPDIAINHDRHALAMHEQNHPKTLHVLEDVWKANLRKLTKGVPVGMLWASPDCKHFSRAKGGKPVAKEIRSLAWTVCKWAEQVQPRVIFLENVREFEDWGPLIPLWTCRECDWKGTEGQATLIRVRRRCPRCESLKLMQTEEMVPCKDRKGQTFKRFCGRLRNLGYTLEHKNLDAADYGAPTHRRRLFLIARCDGEQIIWPEPTHGKSESESNRRGVRRSSRRASQGSFDFVHQSLAPYRTAAECIDWEIPCPSIFERKRALAEKTGYRIAHGIKRYVLDDPQPFLVAVNHGESGGRRWYPLDEPFRTMSQKLGEALIVPTLVRQFGGSTANSITDPVATVTAGGMGKTSLVSAYLAKHFGGMVGCRLDQPGPTTTMRGTQNQIVAANLIHLNHGDKQWSSVTEPMRTLTTGNHAALVYSFLVKYFGTAIGQSLLEPLGSVTTKERYGLVTVTIDGELYVIVDIGMRMLTPRELARAQGFPDDYILPKAKTRATAAIGNSVCPPIARAIVAANYKPQRVMLCR